MGTPVLAPLGRAGMVLIFTVFMLLKREDLRNRLLRLAGLSQLNLMTQALDDASGRVSRYLLMQFLVNAGFGALFGLGLYCIGVPYAPLWGVVGGILRYVPYVGTLISATLPLALSLAVFDGWLRPLLVFVLVASLELTIANFIEPWLYGTRVGISSLALLVTAVFWTVLWGPAGLILSTPLTVCVVVLGRYFPQLSFLHTLLGDERCPRGRSPDLPAVAGDGSSGSAGHCRRISERQAAGGAVRLGAGPGFEHGRTGPPQRSLGTAREEFFFLSINEMVVELSEYRLADTTAIADTGDHPNHRIVCLPATTGPMRSWPPCWLRSWSKKGSRLCPFPLGSSLNECLASIGSDPGDVVCISALPPYAFAPARAMCKQIRELVPETQSGDLRLGIQRRYAQSHGSFRANAARSPLHQPRGGRGSTFRNWCFPNWRRRLWSRERRERRSRR